MTSRQVEQRRTASESVTLPALTAQALAALQAAGLDFESLELDAEFRRKPRHDHLWYVADTGVGRNGQPWLMVTAGNAKVTGDVSLALAATLTRAGRWPDGSTAAKGSALIWSGEDDPRDTLVPRLLACGADLARVHFVGSVAEEDGLRAFDPARDADLLRDHAAAMDPAPALLIVDPIVSAVGGDSHRNAEVRRGLQPLVDLAMALRCVVLGISHFTKGTAGRDPVERVTGSLAFGALARVVLAAAKVSEEDGGGRILARAKNNLGPDVGGFTYELEPLELPDHPGVHTTRILWGAPLEGTARELLGRATRRSQTAGASFHTSSSALSQSLKDTC